MDGYSCVGSLTDLPVELLTRIMVCLDSPVDVALLICTCTTLRDVAAVVPFSFNLCFLTQTHDVGVSRAWTMEALGSLWSQMPSTSCLDLSYTWIMDEDVAAILHGFKHLRCLLLDGCQKLTSGAVKQLVETLSSGLHTVSFQRCFGIEPEAVGKLIIATATGSCLQSIMFSHLDHLEIPMNISADLNKENCLDLSLKKLKLNTFSGTGLQILALNNCSCIDLDKLQALGSICPLLEMLMLGGSAESLGLIENSAVSEEGIFEHGSAILSVVKLLPKIHVLELTFFPRGIISFVREAASPSVEVWDFSQELSVVSAYSYFRNSKCALLHRCWCSKDISLVDMHTRSWLDSASSAETSHLKGVIEGEERNSILCRRDIWVAIHAASNCSDGRKRTPLHIAASTGDILTVHALLAFGAKAMGAKDTGGATALFRAAEGGYDGVCLRLLKAGADPLMCNRAGENSFYIAALRGHCSVVKVLVDFCSKRGISWEKAAAYENMPRLCVKVLYLWFSDFLPFALIGDGWTPLMAAAVADRQAVAKILMNAVGVKLDDGMNFLCMNGVAETDSSNVNLDRFVIECHSSFESVRNKVNWKLYSSTCSELVDAQNRYGQTALHIAARKDSIWFVCALLIAGASTETKDGYMMRAVDVASKHKHVRVVSILRHWDSIKGNFKIIGQSLHIKGDAISNSNGNSIKVDNVIQYQPKKSDSSKQNRSKSKGLTAKPNNSRRSLQQQQWRVKG